MYTYVMMYGNKKHTITKKIQEKNKQKNKSIN